MAERPPTEPNFRQVVDAAPMGMAVVEAPARILWSNPAFRETLGAGGLGEAWLESATAEGDSPGLGTAIREALTTGRAATLPSVRIAKRGENSGTLIDLDVRPLPVVPGQEPRALLTVRDRTDLARANEEALLFRESFLSSSNAIEVTDRDGFLVDVNPAFERIYGYPRAECLGRKPSFVAGRSTPRELYAQMWRSLVDPSRGHWSGELMNRDRRGRERPVFLTITAIRNAASETTHYLGVAIDLSEQKTWERGAGHADKLASLGQLAAGVAHEINTPLANVMLIAESIRRRSSDPWVRSRVDTISGQVELAGTIVRGLLEFARRGDPQVAKLDLAEVTRDALDFLRGKQSADIEFMEQYPPAPVPIWGDRGQLIQVVTNLVNNACEAMDGSGVVRVVVRQDGTEAEVEVADTGPGIPSGVFAHLFEPFFTTKPEGRGTGLGLAISQGIIQAHHGTVTVVNRPEGGASFTVRLPVTTSELATDG
jgi:PAS domain S-box-containing protein